MQLGHSHHRQLLSRCSLRWYSVPADAVAASGKPVPPRLKRPLANSFGGIDIQNVVVPTRSASKNIRNKTIRPSQPHGSNNDQSPDGRRASRPERNRWMGRDGASSGWGDGLVSLSFSDRLRLHQKKSSSNARGAGTGARPQEEGQSWRQKSDRTQRPQMHGHRHGQRMQQEQGDDASQMHHHRRGKSETSMTRPTFKVHHPQSKTTPAAQKAAPASPHASSSNANAKATQPTTSADRESRLAVLSSTNLNALFRTNTSPGPTAGISLPSLPSSATTAPASASDRVRSVLERSAGDYSRYVGARKNALPLPVLRKAHRALGTQRDVSLEQRRVAIHIIGGLVQPRREVRA